MKTTTIAILILTLMMSSCASIITGSTDAVSFNSDPEDARVYVDGEIVGKTPCQAQVSRSWGSGKIRMELLSKVYRTEVPRVFNGWYVGNLAFGLSGIVIGALLIDLPTGNVRKTPSGTVIYYDFKFSVPDKKDKVEAE